MSTKKNRSGHVRSSIPTWNKKRTAPQSLKTLPTTGQVEDAPVEVSNPNSPNTTRSYHDAALLGNETAMGAISDAGRKAEGTGSEELSTASPKRRSAILVDEPVDGESNSSTDREEVEKTLTESSAEESGPGEKIFPGPKEYISTEERLDMWTRIQALTHPETFDSPRKVARRIIKSGVDLTHHKKFFPNWFDSESSENEVEGPDMEQRSEKTQDTIKFKRPRVPFVMFPKFPELEIPQLPELKFTTMPSFDWADSLDIDLDPYGAMYGALAACTMQTGISRVPAHHAVMMLNQLVSLHPYSPPTIRRSSVASILITMFVALPSDHPGPNILHSSPFVRL